MDVRTYRQLDELMASLGDSIGKLIAKRFPTHHITFRYVNIFDAEHNLNGDYGHFELLADPKNHAVENVIPDREVVQ